MMTGMGPEEPERKHFVNGDDLAAHMKENFGSLLGGPSEQQQQAALAANSAGQQADGDGSESAPDESDAG
jgi:hypothetical protein